MKRYPTIAAAKAAWLAGRLQAMEIFAVGNKRYRINQALNVEEA